MVITQSLAECNLCEIFITLEDLPCMVRMGWLPHLNPLLRLAAVEILRRGGNAIDAAISAGGRTGCRRAAF